MELDGEKFNYILKSKYINGDVTTVANAFGYTVATQLSKIRKGKAKLPTIYILGLEHYFDIPMKIFDATVPMDKKIINELIEDYRIKKVTNKANGTPPTGEKQKSLLTKLTAHPYYAYMYASHPHSAIHDIDENGEWIKNLEGISVNRTVFHADLSVIDQHENSGTLILEEHQGIIIKKSYEEKNANIIRFDINQALYGNFHFLIFSNQNGTVEEMVNFGFYSKMKLSPQEAQKILGDDKSKIQLKLDCQFKERVKQI